MSGVRGLREKEQTIVKVKTKKWLKNEDKLSPGVEHQHWVQTLVKFTH